MNVPKQITQIQNGLRNGIGNGLRNGIGNGLRNGMNNYLRNLMGTNGKTSQMYWIAGTVVGILVILAIGWSSFFFTEEVQRGHHHNAEGFETDSTISSKNSSDDQCSCAFADTPLTPEGKKMEAKRIADEKKKAAEEKKKTAEQKKAADKKAAEKAFLEQCSKQPLPMEGLGIAKIIVEYSPKTLTEQKPSNISIAILKDEAKDKAASEKKSTAVDKCTALELSGFNKTWTKNDVKELMKTEDGKHLLDKIDKEYKFLTGAETLSDEDIAACYKNYV